MFSAACVAPGYVLLRFVRAVLPQQWSAREQLAWSVALSLGPGVLLLAGVVAWGGASAGAALLGSLAAVALWQMRGSIRISAVNRPAYRRVLGIVAVWTAIVLLSLIDFGMKDRLWMSVTAYDHGLRTAFVDAVLRTGAPPVDPVYWPGHDVPMRYYYFWYEVCAAVARLAHISARQALIASCVWPPVGVVAMLALFARYVLERRGRELSRFVRLTTGLLWVCGLDLLVTIALHLIGTPVMPDMEWWSIDQVASWPDTFLWVPHHAAAVVAALLGVLLLLQAAKAVTKRQHLALAAAAGMSFSAAFGMSAYVAVAAVFLALGSLLLNARRSSGWAYARGLLIAGALSVVSLGRFFYQLTRRDGAGTASGSPLYLGVREILDPTMLTGSRLFQALAARHPWRAREISALILLVPGWAVELGFYAVVLGIVLYRFRRSPAGERTIAVLALSGLLGASVLRSGVIATNDYGIRSALLAQFCLLLLGAMVFEASAGTLRLFLWVLIAAGGGASVYQLVLLRTYVPAQEASGNRNFQEIGERTYALRDAYEALQVRIPSRAHLQYDPETEGFFLYPHLLYGNRQLITAEFPCSVSFGGDPAACPAIRSHLSELFPQGTASAPAAAGAQKVCVSLGTQYLVVTPVGPGVAVAQFVGLVLASGCRTAFRPGNYLRKVIRLSSAPSA